MQHNKAYAQTVVNQTLQTCNVPIFDLVVVAMDMRKRKICTRHKTRKYSNCIFYFLYNFSPQNQLSLHSHYLILFAAGPGHLRRPTATPAPGTRPP